jgi:hypothetical protein
MKLVSQVERIWSADLPAASVLPGTLEYYFESYEGVSGAYGSTLEHRQPYAVRVNGGTSRPVISHVPAVDVRGKSAVLRVEVSDSRPVTAVRVYYKRQPAWHEWLSVDMKPATRAAFEATVPLTPEGILYYFEAENADGNATNNPNFLRETPYFVIAAWDPALNTASR